MVERSITDTARPAAHYYTSTLVSLPGRSVALVLAGGKGSRLRDAADPELHRTPKVLVPIDTPAGRTPMLGHALAQLAAAGFRRIAVLTSSDPATGAEAVESYALTHAARRVELTVHREDHPLGTAGAAYAALHHLSDAPAAVVLPADTLFPVSQLPSAVAAHRSPTCCTWIVPGSHRAPYVGVPQPDGGGTWMDEHPELAELAEQAVPVPAPAGGVLLFDGTVLHTVGANSGGSTRTSVVLGYRAADELDAHPDPDRQVVVAGAQLYRGNDRPNRCVAEASRPGD